MSFLCFSVTPKNKSLFHTFFSWWFINNLVVDKQKFVKNLSCLINNFPHLAFIWSVSFFHIFFLHSCIYVVSVFISKLCSKKRGEKITFWFQFISACISRTALTALVLPTLPHHEHVHISFFVTKPRLFCIHDLPIYVSLFFWTCHRLLTLCQNVIYLNGCDTWSRSYCSYYYRNYLCVICALCLPWQSWKNETYSVINSKPVVLYFIQFILHPFLVNGWSFKVVSYTAFNTTSFYFCWFLEIYLV